MSKKFVFGGSYSGVAPFVNTYSLIFDGVNEYVNLGRMLMTEGASNFSASFWIKPVVIGGQVVFGKFSNANQHIYGSTRPDGGIDFVISNGVSYRFTTTSAGKLTSNVWCKLDFVYDGTQATDILKAKIYVNGVDVTNSSAGVGIPTTLTTSTAVIAYGARGGDFVGQFNGLIDEPAFYDYSLTQTEITDRYNAGVPTDLMSLAVSKRPEHYYRNGDGDTFPTITDIGETGGNNGTMVNMEIGDIITDVP